MTVFECTLLINALAHVFNALATFLKTPRSRRRRKARR
jgi:hypothetical protein